MLTPWIQLCCHTEPIYSSGDSAVTDAGKSYRTHIPVPLHIPAPARLRGGSGRARKSTELAEHSHTATLSGGDSATRLEQKLPFFFPSFPSKSPSRLEVESSLEKLGKCSDLVGPQRHFALQPSQEKLPSQPRHSCASPMEEKATLEPCLLCKGTRHGRALAASQCF